MREEEEEEDDDDDVEAEEDEEALNRNVVAGRAKDIKVHREEGRGRGEKKAHRAIRAREHIET